MKTNKDGIITIRPKDKSLKLKLNRLYKKSNIKSFNAYLDEVLTKHATK